MQACVDILNVKRIMLNGTSLDTVETLKEKISKATSLKPCFQTVHVLQSGTKVEWKDDSNIYFGDLVKKKAVIYLSCKKKSTSSYYINIVTETGRVLLVTLKRGNWTTINDLKQQLSALLGLHADSLFLRIVELSRCVNKPLKELFNTLEDYCVISGSVLYVQIHPWSYNWFHGKITCNKAEEVMSSASHGQFLVKESVRFPGDYVLFVCDAGKVVHFRVLCYKNMMFAPINCGRNFFSTIAEMVQFYMSREGLLIKGKLTDPVPRQELSECTGGEGLTTDSSLVRPRLHTRASSEVRVNVVVGSKTFSLLTSTLNQVQSLKVQIEEMTGESADCQLLRLDKKVLVMNDFLLSDYHITENSTIYVQVHPWNEDWYVGNLTHSEIESAIQDVSVANGMFLIKDSETSLGNYCLCVWSKSKPGRYLVEFKENRFQIFGDDQQFNTLTDLVEHCKSHRGSLKVRLTEPVKIDKELKCIIPPAVIARGNKAKAAYRRALENGKTCDARVRIMLIGEDKAGKTSLKRSLKGESFNRHEASTLGVDMDAPLLKDALKVWNARKADENITVFDHRSAQLVARQLSEPNGSRASDFAMEYPTRKGFSCSEANCSERSFAFSKLPSASHGVFNGIGPCKDLDNFTQRFKGMNATDHYEEPPSPLLQDDVFTNDQVLSDTLPQNMASLVKEILTSDQDPLDKLPQNVASLVERMLQKEHSVSEEVWPVIWDFSGQSLLHGMNPIFMSREAVYILVSDLTKDVFSREDMEQPARATSMECRADCSFDHLVRWMNMVHSFQDTSAASVIGTTQPPVILVGTHADKVIGDPWKPLNAILDSFHGKAFSSHIVDEKFIVDNTRAGQTQEDPNISRLWQKIISVASALPRTKREIPLQWLRVEKVLRRLASEGFNYVTLQQFKAVAKRVCRFKVDEDSNELLHFLCDCGAVLYFNETDDSNSLVFLDPQWLVRLFCQIMTVVSGKKEPMKIRECRQTLAKKGILSEELVSFACGQEPGPELSKESLLSVMEKASLVCRLEDQNGELVYRVPSMLPATPEDEILRLTDQCLTAPVYITFNTGYIPYGLFSRFVVSFSYWASKKYSARPPKMSANTARFFIGKKNDCSLTFAFFKSVIMVHVLREDGKQEGTEISTVCQEVNRFFEENLASLLRCPWLHSVTWQLCARCDLCVGETDGGSGCSWHQVPSCLHPDCAHFIPLDSDPLRCNHTIKLKTRLDEEKVKPWLKICRPNHFQDDLPYKPGLVSQSDLLNLSHDVGLQWKKLCCILLGGKELEHIDHDQKTLDDKCFTMLDRWRGSQASDATYAALGMALMHEDLQADELCRKYCQQSQGVLESSV